MFSGHFEPDDDDNDSEDRAAMNAVEAWSVVEAGSAMTSEAGVST
jgi:hypothetical protein